MFCHKKQQRMKMVKIHLRFVHVETVVVCSSYLLGTGDPFSSNSLITHQPQATSLFSPVDCGRKRTQSEVVRYKATSK